MTAGFATIPVANGFLNAIRSGGTSLTVVAGTYVKLHVGDPGAAGTSAPSVGDATRKAVTQGAAVAGAITLNGTQPVWTNGGTAETISHVSVWDSSSAGTFLYSSPLVTPQPWDAGNTFTLTTLTVTAGPLAS